MGSVCPALVFLGALVLQGCRWRQCEQAQRGARKTMIVPPNVVYPFAARSGGTLNQSIIESPRRDGCQRECGSVKIRA